MIYSELIESKIQYLNGYLEFAETFNTELSGKFTYHFEAGLLEEIPPEEKTIRLQQLQTILYQWFAKEFLEESYLSALWQTAETFCDILAIEIFQRLNFVCLLVIHSPLYSEIVLHNNEIKILLTLAKEEKP